ncbi:MAG: hypothetical protein MUP47_07340, partial [Phycisphaerae bacterium]|nr:hypothetical protein [Phycisphaerae bacterium]
MGELFEKEAPQGSSIVSVAVVANVWRTYDYLWPQRLGVPRRGRRVRVPFGRGDKQTVGFVVATDVPPGPPLRASVGTHKPACWRGKLKSVAETLDAVADAE